MAENSISHFRQERDCRRTKKEDNLSCSNSTLAETMREQPKATKLVHSPRRATKNVGKLDQNSKSKSLLKETKVRSDDSSSSSLSLFEGREKRKSLQVLQPSADGQKLLVGGKHSPRTKPKSKTQQRKDTSSSSQKKLKHYLTKSSDETQSSSSEVESTTTSVPVKSEIPTSSDEAYALMVQERAPEKYWELVAEERRKSLEETLKENMKLYEIIERLKEENAILKERANNTDYFATMYKITKDDVPSTEDTSHDSL